MVLVLYTVHLRKLTKLANRVSVLYMDARGQHLVVSFMHIVCCHRPRECDQCVSSRRWSQRAFYGSSSYESELGHCQF